MNGQALWNSFLFYVCCKYSSSWIVVTCTSLSWTEEAPWLTSQQHLHFPGNSGSRNVSVSWRFRVSFWEKQCMATDGSAPMCILHRVFIQISFALTWEVCSMLDMGCESSYGKGSFWILFKPQFLQLVLSFLHKSSRCSIEHSLINPRMKSDTKWGRSVWMCVCVHMYMYAYLYCAYSCIYAQQCTSAYVCKCMYVHVYVCAYMHMCICVYMCVHVYYADCVMEPETVIFYRGRLWFY